MHPWLVRYIVPADLPIIGGQDLSIPSLYVLGAFGFVLALWVVVRSADRLSQDPAPILDLSVYYLVGGIVGGRLGYLLIDARTLYLDNPSYIFDLWRGGLNLFGSLVVCMAITLWYARSKGHDPLSLFDAVVPALSVGLVVGRLGNLADGSAYGRPIDFPWGVEWPWGVALYSDVVPELLRGVVLHPTQVYLALGNLLLFLALWRVAGKRAFNGQLLAIWAVGYGVMRLLVDAFRMDAVRLGGWVTVNQVLALVLVIAGLVVYVRGRAAAPAPEQA